jgi:hypothetical protein
METALAIADVTVPPPPTCIGPAAPSGPESKRHRRLPELVGDHAAWQPEKRLMLAVLQDAVVTLLDNCVRRGGRARRLCAETVAWFIADDEEWPFSFVNICDAAKLDASRVRAWVGRRVAEARPCARPLELLPASDRFVRALTGGTAGTVG